MSFSPDGTRHTRMAAESGQSARSSRPAPDAPSALTELIARREYACRLTPDRALATLDGAVSFALDRGMITRTPDCALPSLFGACHEESYASGGRGFASWPKTKWWWGGALTERPGIHYLKIHRGAGLYCSPEVVTLADPLCRAALSGAETGDYGSQAQRLVTHLAVSGPALIGDLTVELGYEAAALRKLRERLERVGAIVSRPVTSMGSQGGHTHSSELARWDQLFGAAPPTDGPGGVEELLVAGVRAAVIAPEGEARSWFSWPISQSTVERLVTMGRLQRPAPGWLASPAE